MWPPPESRFIPVRLVDKGGPKPAKVPLDHRTGKAGDPHDPATWLDYPTAAALTGLVGYVLAPDSGRFCLDIDHCLLPSGQWSPLALEVVAAFPGCYVEVSNSGQGLHIWGRYSGAAPAHACRGREGLELYHEQRFFLLGLPGGTGDPDTDATTALAAAIARWFPPLSGGAGLGEDWIDLGVDPAEDDILLAKALDSQSVLAGWAGTAPKASFRHLWEANEAALSAAYPSPDPAKPWDLSAADSALAYHLTFWVGWDHERVSRLMHRSALVREKWGREDYLPNTIRKAVAARNPDQVYGGATLCKVDHQQAALCRAEPDPPYTADPGRFNFQTTEGANARRLARIHGKRLRHVGDNKTWRVWDGTVWRDDGSRQVYDLAADVVRRVLLLESSALKVAGKDEIAEDLEKWAKKSDSDKGLNAIVSIARGLPGIPAQPADFDADPWALNTPSGLVDLRTGTVRPQEPEDLLFRVAGAPYAAGATAPLWGRFLERVTGGDRELQAYLQRAVGYSLTGDTREHRSFWLYGLGRNGKSVFLETITALLGTYSGRLGAESLMVGRGQNASAPRPEIAALVGQRLVTATEPNENSRMNEGLIKELTGGDTVTARQLFGRNFTFRPQLKLWVAGNHKPRVEGTDYGIWSRIDLVPFTVTIPEHERDQELGQRLRETELPGILNWALEGCREFQRQGLGSCRAVLEATQEYREESDDLGLFLAEQFDLAADGHTPSKKLFDDYKLWCMENGVRLPLTKTMLGRKLHDRGFKSGRTENYRFWAGLTPKATGSGGLTH